ncbi:MAG: branched-chain amino acid ABC transporter permease [Nitratireductor sp.]|uniref:branched-chain amino acid ABC transporter permease n=1 Tax=Alphaproteobacteria TaxID=28211 RepID=UPI003274B5FE
MSNTTQIGDSTNVSTVGSTRPETNESRSHFVWIFLALAALVAVLPAFAYPLFLMKVMCFAIFAIGFNLLLGYCGLLSLGHAAFFGAGGYTAAFVAVKWGFPPELVVLCGVIASTLVGAAFGLLAIRRHGIYLTMITLGLAQMVYFIVFQSPYSGAEDGIQGVPRGVLFGHADLRNDMTLYFVVSVVFMVVLLASYRLTYSPFGQVLRAVRDSESRATSLGLNVRAIKLTVFTISAAVSGLAGAMKAVIFQIATLVDVHLTTSGEVLLMTLIGGVGTVLGPVVGAAVLVTSQNYLAGFGQWVTFIQGFIFVVSVLAFREGIVGLLARLWRRPL